MERFQRRQVIDALEREAIARGIVFNGLRTTLLIDRDQDGDPTGWLYLAVQKGGFDSTEFVGIVAVPPIHVAMFVDREGRDLQESERATVLFPELPTSYPTEGKPLYPGGRTQATIEWRRDDAIATEPPWADLLVRRLGTQRPAEAVVNAICPP